MAEKIEDLTVTYTDGGIETVKELDKAILSKGSWTTILFRYQDWDRSKEEYGKEKYTIRRYQKRNGEYRQQSKFNISSQAQAELPAFEKVSEDYKKVEVSDQQNKVGLFNLWKREKDSQLLGELPRKYANKSYFIALTVSSGDRYAGLQAGDIVMQ